jgi:hypothetical protein
MKIKFLKETAVIRQNEDVFSPGEIHEVDIVKYRGKFIDFRFMDGSMLCDVLSNCVDIQE